MVVCAHTVVVYAHTVVVCVLWGGGAFINMGPGKLFSSRVLTSVNPHSGCVSTQWLWVRIKWLCVCVVGGGDLYKHGTLKVVLQ